MRGYIRRLFLRVVGFSLAAVSVSLGGCESGAARHAEVIAPPPEVVFPVLEHHAPPAPSGSSLMDLTLDNLAIQRDRILTLYDQARHKSADALNKNQFPQARSEASYALELVDQNENLFSDPEIDALRSAARRLLDHVESRWQQFRADEQSASAATAAQEARIRAVSAADQRHQRAKGLIADAQKLYDASEFHEAAGLLRQATLIDPQNEDAQLFLRLTTDKITDREYAAIEHRTSQEVTRQNIDSAEHLIPYSNLAVYPDNWAEITRKRQ
ncbi:MAG TPA: hypothetical protein VGN88_09880 [Phycisphaerae bacterium]|jgi:hypothetical protein